MSALAKEFFAAIQAGDDDLTESIALQLTAADESALLAAFAEGDNEVRWWVVRCLALIGGKDAILLLAGCLDDADPLLRVAALLGFAAIHSRNPQAVQPQLEAMAQRLADNEGMVRQAASDALAQCGNDAVPFLVAVLRGKHEGARTRAAQALRQIATMPAAAALYRCLNDENYMVHTYAYEGLDEMGLLETMLLAV